LDNPNSTVVDIRNLTRRFGSKAALDDVTFTVPQGCVFGLIGENGAGKTTLIKHILGLLKAQQGNVRVFGLDPVASPTAVLARIGYLSEQSDLPSWMTIGELMRYTRAFYPTWDQAYSETLIHDFDLESNLAIKRLSKGQRARAGLLLALSYRPDLLLLDEPSSGLDPIVRRDIVGAIIRTIADEGRTVVFSSHMLGEVERVADYVAMMKGGKIILCDRLDSIKDSHYRATFQLHDASATPPYFDKALSWEGVGREWSALCEGSLVNAEIAAGAMDAKIVEHSPATLDDIFVARIKSNVP